VVVYVHFHSVSLILNLLHGLVSQLQLVSEVVDVSLECFNLGDVVLLFLLILFDGE